MYDIEKYYNARSVSEAAMLLMEHPEARIISGGKDGGYFAGIHSGY